MPEITVTFKLTPETLEILKLLTKVTENNGDSTPETAQPATESKEEKKPAKKAAAKSKKEAEEKPAKEEAPSESEKPAPAIELTDVRAVALKLSKAGKKDVLKEIFGKYGAKTLLEVPEEDYGALMKDLEAANG